jgi:hypothetical protein
MIIAGFPNYTISREAVITNVNSGRIISQFTTEKGYKSATLFNEGKKQNKKIHKLLAKAYIFGYNDEIIDHKNRDRLDNRLCNLRISNQNQNCHNRNPTQKNGLPTGVYIKHNGCIIRYKSTITIGYYPYVEYFDCIPKAVMFRCLKRIEHGLI